MAKSATKSAPVKAAAKRAPKAAPKSAPKAAKKSAPKAVAKPAAKAAWGEKSQLIYDLATRKQGMTAADIKAVTGWKSASAKAIAHRFAVTWGNAENNGKPFKVVKVSKEGEPVAYRFA